jgi:hypothetical protein
LQPHDTAAGRFGAITGHCVAADIGGAKSHPIFAQARTGECCDALWKGINMKLFLLMAIAAMAVASLTDGASAKHRHHSRYPYASVTVYGSGYHSLYDVYSARTYVGSDPDPQTRAQMLMDYNRGVYGLGNR